MMTSKARMVEMKQKLTDKQIASFLKHDWMLSTNMYDKFYKMVRDKVKDLQKMRKKKIYWQLYFWQEDVLHREAG